jgi:hypothetical protein
MAYKHIMFHIYATYIVPGSILFPVLAALLNFRHISKPAKVILWFLLFSAVLNIVNLVMIQQSRRTTHLFHIYSVFEFGFLSLFYGYFFEKWGKRIIGVIVLLFTILCLVNVIYLQKQTEFNTYTRSLEAIIIIAYGLIIFNKQNNLDESGSWGQYSLNWFNTGVLLYYASCIFMFAFANQLLRSSLVVNQIVWGAHDTVLMVEYILFAIGFYRCRQQQQTTLSY